MCLYVAFHWHWQLIATRFSCVYLMFPCFPLGFFWDTQTASYEGIKVCTFVTPEVAGELELTILHAMIDPLEPLRPSTDDVIVSKSFENLVMLTVDARSNNTPRRNRPRLKRQVKVPRLGSSGFELGKLRDYVGANFNGETPSSDALSRFA